MDIKGENKLTNCKVFGNCLGDNIHVQLKRVQLFKGNFVGVAHRAHDCFLVKHLLARPAHCQPEGNNDINQIRKIRVKFIVFSKFFQYFLTLLTLLKNDEFGLLGIEQFGFN